MSNQTHDGFDVVLTADAILMADYRVLFDGMTAASMTTTMPEVVMRSLIAPPMPSTGLTAPRAPMGLRRIESALVAGDFKRDDVVVVTPRKLASAVGERTRIVGISTGDPLGLGMNSTTMTGILGGRTYSSTWFEQLLRRVRRLCPAGSAASIIVGGPGAWQLAQEGHLQTRLGVDHVVVGHCETEVSHLFASIRDGKDVPAMVRCSSKVSRTPPAILGPTLMGVVEVSRGCGLGCDFCTMAGEPMVHLPTETILHDARVNVEAGGRDISLISEDIFRFGAEDAHDVNPERLKELLCRLRELPNMGRMHVDHANVGSVVNFTNRDLAEIYTLLTGDADERYLWVNLGVETASPRLIDATCGGKLRPHSAQEWPGLCHEQVRRLASVGFVPMVSLLVGLPDETETDLEATTTWVRKLDGLRVTVFPMFVAPFGTETKSFTLRDMTSAHWRLFGECYRLNRRWVPRLCWDNQTGAGVPLVRRLGTWGLLKGGLTGWQVLLSMKSGRIM